MAQFRWISRTGTWSFPANWDDLSTGTNPASVAPAAADDATIDAGTLFVANGPGAAADLTTTGDLGVHGSFTIGGALSAQGTLALLPASSLSVGSIALSGSLLVLGGTGTTLTDAGSIAGIVPNLANPTFVAVNHATMQVLAPTGPLNLTGETDATGSIEFGGAGVATPGEVTVDSGTTISDGSIGSDVVDNGTIAASGATPAGFTIDGNVTGTGQLRIAASGRMTLNGTTVTPDIVFAGAGGVLDLDTEFTSPPIVTGTITGFDSTDVIPLDNYLADSAVWTPAGGGGTLTLADGGTTVLALTLAGDYTGDTFYAVPTAVFFAAGTRIVVAPTVAVSPAPTGTATNDTYSWTAGNGPWADATHWLDGGTAAALAPGSTDGVTIAGATGGPPLIVTGDGDAASLTTSGDLALKGEFDVAGTLSNNGTLALMAGTSLTAASANVTGELLVSGNGASFTDSGTLTLINSTALEDVGVWDHGVIHAANLVLTGGVVNLLDSTDSVSTGAVEIGTAGGAAPGAFTIDSGATVAAVGNGPFSAGGGIIFGPVVDNGVIDLTKGLAGLVIVGPVTGNGVIEIGNNANFMLNGSTLTAGVVFQGATSSLDIEQPFPVLRAQTPPVVPTISGTISGFAPPGPAADTIRLGDVITDSASWSPTGGGLGTVTLSNAGTPVLSLTLAGDYTGDTFYALPFGGGGVFGALGTELVVVPSSARTVAPAGNAIGLSYDWDGSSNNNYSWSNPANWKLGASDATVAPGINDTVSIANSIDTVVVGDGNAATLTLGGAVLQGSFTVSGGVNVTGDPSSVLAGSDLTAGSIAINDGGTLLVAGTGAQVTDAGTISVNGALSAVAVANHASVRAASLDLESAYNVTIDDTASMEIGAGGSGAIGKLTVDAGAIVTVGGRSIASTGIMIQADVIDDGTIALADGGSALSIDGDVTGTGSLLIGQDGTLTLDGATITPDMVFQGSGGTLDFAQTAVPSVTGTINLELDNASWAPGGGGLGTLTLSNTGTTLASLTLAGDFSSDTFNTVPGTGNGSPFGTRIVLDAPVLCFAADTRIQTDTGERAIQNLRAGTLVAVESGGFRPVRWIGRRRIDLARHAEPDRVRPVRVNRHAFGPNQPCRDLILSPDHAIFADGILVPARHLVNDTTVAQCTETRAVEYFHIELDTHEIVFANGLPAESLLPGSDRESFENAGNVMTLHPDFGRLRWEAEGYAPLTVTGPVFEALRARLAALAIARARRRAMPAT